MKENLAVAAVIVTTAAAFTPTQSTRVLASRRVSIPGPLSQAATSTAVADGDFAMLEGELQPVLRNMRKESSKVVGIHQHISTGQPRYFYPHHWGKGKAVDLAQFLDDQAAVKS